MVVPGRAVPAQRMTQRSKQADPKAKRALEYQRLVALCAWRARAPQFTGPVRLTCRFWFKNHRHGDLSNLIKAIEDGLQYAGVLQNDRQVVRYGAGTGIYYGPEERAEVIIEEVVPCLWRAKGGTKTERSG
ncbi:MAG: RusA family crossover junction endodeoxyribonuclease [Candidatus Bipolaricaulaceae bacterium]